MSADIHRGSRHFPLTLPSLPGFAHFYLHPHPHPPPRQNLQQNLVRWKWFLPFLDAPSRLSVWGKMKYHNMMIYFFLPFLLTLVVWLLCTSNMRPRLSQTHSYVTWIGNHIILILASELRTGTGHCHQVFFKSKHLCYTFQTDSLWPKMFIFKSDCCLGIIWIWFCLLVVQPDSIVVCRSVDEASIRSWQKTIVFWIKWKLVGGELGRVMNEARSRVCFQSFSTFHPQVDTEFWK